MTNVQKLPRPFLFVLGLALSLTCVGIFHWVNTETMLSVVSGENGFFFKGGIMNSIDDLSVESTKGNLGADESTIPVLLRGELMGRQKEDEVEFRIFMPSQMKNSFPRWSLKLSRNSPSSKWP